MDYEKIIELLQKALLRFKETKDIKEFDEIVDVLIRLRCEMLVQRKIEEIPTNEMLRMMLFAIYSISKDYLGSQCENCGSRLRVIPDTKTNSLILECISCPWQWKILTNISRIRP